MVDNPSRRKVRLVIFDMGDTLMYSQEDTRATDLERTPVGTMLDEDTQVQGEKMARRLFPGVRELFDELTRHNIYIGIASLNEPGAYKWLGSDFFNLNTGNMWKLRNYPKNPLDWVDNNRNQ